MSPSIRPNSHADRGTLRARVVELQGKLRTALADKKSRMNDIVALCRSERRAMREELRSKRATALEQIEHEIQAARASARHLRLSRLAEVRKGADSDIAVARAAIAVERAHQDELRRIAHDQRRRRAEVHRLHEIAAQSGELHTSLLGPFAALVQRVGSKVKPVPGESRAEAVLRYAQTHPGEAHAAAEPRAERVIEETRQEISKTKAALRSAPRPPKGAGVPRKPTRPVPRPTAGKTAKHSPLAIRPIYLDERPVHTRAKTSPAKETTSPSSKAKPQARHPGQLPRGGPGIPLEVLMREREELKSKSKRPGRPYAAAPTARGKHPAPKKTPKTPKTPKKKGGSKPPASTSPPASATGRAPMPPPRSPANQVARERTEKTVKAPDVHDTSALAKLIRHDIQAALAAGDLPRAKYSVTTDKYSMGSSITVVATKLPFPVLNAAAFYPTKFGPQFDSGRFRTRYSAEAEKLQQKLEEIVGAYHWDRSDPMSDYYNERFHKDVRLDDRGEMDRIREKLGKAAKEPSSSDVPFTWREPPGGLLDAGWYASDDRRGRRGPFDSQAEAERS
jgi:hypothetical protein